jgi:hypothetical protein
MPLTFNLLAPWGHTLERASSYLIELLPAFTGAARQILFEHSPGRGNSKFAAPCSFCKDRRPPRFCAGTFHPRRPKVRGFSSGMGSPILSEYLISKATKPLRPWQSE